MGEVVNLRLARKAKARSDKEAAAAENRIRFGKSKDERTREAAEQSASERHLDGHRLDPRQEP